MIEILSIGDVEKIGDPVLRAGVLQEFERLPDDYVYPEYGYFIVVEDSNDFPSVEKLISKYTTRSLQESVEMVEEFEGYRQIVLVLEADFGLSLFMDESLYAQFESHYANQ